MKGKLELIWHLRIYDFNHRPRSNDTLETGSVARLYDMRLSS